VADEYTPTMDEVRAQFPDERDRAWFDRALAAHDAEIRRDQAEKLAAFVKEASEIRRAYLDFWGAHSFNDIQAVGREPQMPDTPALDAALATPSPETEQEKMR